MSRVTIQDLVVQRTLEGEPASDVVGGGHYHDGQHQNGGHQRPQGHYRRGGGWGDGWDAEWKSLSNETTRFDFQPGYYWQHGDHIHYEPGYYQFRQTGRWNY